MLTINWLLYRLPKIRLFIQDHWVTVTSMILAVFVGVFTLKLGTIYSLGLLVAVMVFVATLKYPEFIILLIIGYASGLFPVQFNYSLQVAGRGLFLTDLLFFSLMAALFLKLLARKDGFVRTPLDVPLLILGVAVVIGAATATSFHGIDFSYTTPEARTVLYYLIFFPVTNLIRSEGQLNRLIRGLFLIGILMALMMIGQGIFGASITPIDQSSIRGGGEVIRFFTPGTVTVQLTLMVLICSLAILTDDHRRYMKFVLIIVLSLALLLTVARNLVFSTAISLAVLAVLLRKRQLPRLVVNAISITAIASVALAAFQALGIGPDIIKYLSSNLSRLSHLFTTSVLSPDETLAWRWKEIHYAWQKLMDSPILGIGLFTPYRPPFYPGDPLMAYIHNAYISLWLKTGLLGLSAFLWLSFRFLSRGFRYWRRIPDSFLSTTCLRASFDVFGDDRKQSGGALVCPKPESSSIRDCLRNKRADLLISNCGKEILERSISRWIRRPSTRKSTTWSQ